MGNEKATFPMRNVARILTLFLFGNDFVQKPDRCETHGQTARLIHIVFGL